MHVINFQIPLCLLLMLTLNSFPVTVNQIYFGSWGYLIITIIEGQALMYIVCRKTNANAFGDFAYNFTEATSRNIESRKDACFDTNQNHSMKGAINQYTI